MPLEKEGHLCKEHLTGFLEIPRRTATPKGISSRIKVRLHAHTVIGVGISGMTFVKSCCRLGGMVVLLVPYASGGDQCKRTKNVKF